MKYERSTPILADSLLVKLGNDSSSVPDGYSTGIHMFGEKNAYNLHDQKLIFSTNHELRIYYKQDEEAYKTDNNEAAKESVKFADIETTGSIVSDESMILYLTLSFIAGAVATGIFMTFINKRKRSATVSR